MATLKEIRLRIKSVATTQQTTRAMKMVAASKLRKAQDAITNLRPYANKISEMMGHILQGSEGEIVSPYGEIREVKNVLHVVITSNRGLCGAFNTAIIRLSQSSIENDFAELTRKNGSKVMCIGKKGYDIYSKRGLPLVGENNDVFTKLSFDSVNVLADQVMKGFLEGDWDKVVLYYNKFQNVATQIRTIEDFLPISVNSDDLISKAETKSKKGDTSHKPAQNIDFKFEPQKEEILVELIPKILKVQFYKAILESNVSEHGARMVAMDNATENANELLKELKIGFNKARQAAITKEILEIVGGAEALSGGN